MSRARARRPSWVQWGDRITDPLARLIELRRNVDDFFPEAADLPEDIHAAELEGRYGGVGGHLFRQYAAEVERRLWSCPAYRALAPAAASN